MPGHRSRFVYTPKHCSWLNQIEIGFGISCRRLLNRSSFASLEKMRERILSFVEYFNKTMAKPLQWAFTGKPLKMERKDQDGNTNRNLPIRVRK